MGTVFTNDFLVRMDVVHLTIAQILQAMMILIMGLLGLCVPWCIFKKVDKDGEIIENSYSVQTILEYRLFRMKRRIDNSLEEQLLSDNMTHMM